MTNMTSGDFQLVVQTGNKGMAVPGGQSNVAQFKLPAPAGDARITSWASIVE